MAHYYKLSMNQNMQPSQHDELPKSKVPLILSTCALLCTAVVLAYSVFTIKKATVPVEESTPASTVTKTPTPTMTIRDELEKALSDVEKEASDEPIPTIE